METYKETIIPVEWTGWNEIDINAITIYNAKFTEDFGIFKKDEIYDHLNIFYDEGFIEYWKSETVNKVQHFKAIPLDVSENNIL